MEIVVAIAALLIFDVVALLWGQDSRESLPSKEQTLAGYGVSWGEQQASRGAATS